MMVAFDAWEIPVKLSIVIPVYNEVNTVDLLISAVLKVETGLTVELVVVDDCSNDGTRAVLERAKEKHPEMVFLFHGRNQGKGAALRTGFAAATGDIVLVQDADLEYDPREYPRLLRPILDGHADVVFGSRFLGGGAHRVVFFWHYVGNKLLTMLSNMMTNLNLTDMEVCYKVFKREVLRTLSSGKTGSGLRSRSPPRLPGESGAFMKCLFRITVANTRKVKKSLGKTAFAPCGAS